MAQRILSATVKIDRHGRIVVPADIRQELGLKPGTALNLRVEDGEIRLQNRRERITRVQEKILSRTRGRSLVEELLVERRREASSE